MRRTKCDRGGKIRAHAHREKLQSIALRDFCGQRKMRPRSLVERRNAHEAGDCQPILIATRRQECIGILRQDTGFLRLRTGIDFGKERRPLLLFTELLRKRFAKACPIDRMDRVEKRDRLFRLVRLQWSDEMQLRARVFREQSWPLCFRLLDAVLAKDALTGADGRLMRSLKSVLGTSLFSDTTRIKRRAVPFSEIVLPVTLMSVGATLFTRTVVVAEPEPVSSSVTVSDTV